MMGPDMVTIIITILIKPVLLLMIIGVLFLLLSKSSAALRHFCLLMGFVALLILPVSAFLIPDMAWQFPFSQLLFDLLPFSWKEFLLKTSYVQMEPIGWKLTLALYLLVSTSILSYLLIGFISLWVIYHQSSPVTNQDTLAVVNELSQLLDIRHQIKIVVGKKIESPCVWGFGQPKILLPLTANNWTHEQKISVLMHELGHIYRKDTLSLLIVKITCAIFWFLPPVWWFAKKMSEMAEVACDDLIYRLRGKHIQYAEHLLQLADHYQSPSPLVMSMAGHSEIYQRIMAVLDTKKPREIIKPEKIQYPLLLGLLLLIVMASVSTIQWPQAESDISKVNLRWEKPKSKKIYPTDESIVDAENTLIKVDWLENQEKPSLNTNELPYTKPEIGNLKGQYKVEINKQDLFIDAENSQLDKQSSALYQLIRAPELVYPQVAIKKGLSGYIKVSFTLNAEGIPDNIVVTESSPEGVFDQAIINALKNSQYQWKSLPDLQHRIRKNYSFQLEKPPPR